MVFRQDKHDHQDKRIVCYGFKKKINHPLFECASGFRNRGLFTPSLSFYSYGQQNKNSEKRDAELAIHLCRCQGARRYKLVMNPTLVKAGLKDLFYKEGETINK